MLDVGGAIALAGPALGHLVFVGRFLLSTLKPESAHSAAVRASMPPVSVFEWLGVLFVSYVVTFAFAYALGLIPAALGSWVYMSLTRRMHVQSFALRLLIAPVIGLAAIGIFLLPLLLSVRDSILDPFFLMPLSAGAFAAFTSVLLFDRRYVVGSLSAVEAHL